ncbi:hypothetical protein MKK70_25265 [Methylobacterium sp. E-041]|uniref:hypothetical protein n=1 Tax=Methylobacterium sp. E-041 TaxID=2836573 RepID=UPI001FBA6B39|nr:hypothetical protein [Methylobacterium sp. E-041]MCJ2108622.1 hypothetical protein [Methylobacterium sp. E-041]
MREAQTMTDLRLDFGRPALPADVALIYGDPSVLEGRCMAILQHLSRITRRRASALAGAVPVLASLARCYLLEQRAQGTTGVSVGSPASGVSVHFLIYVLDHLPAGLWPREQGVLRTLIDGAIATWREANPGVTPEPVVVGIGIV